MEECNLTAKLLTPEDDVAPIAEAHIENEHTVDIIPPVEDRKHLESTQEPPLAYLSDDAPPPNAPSGGIWGKQRFRGRLTAAATVGGVLIACLPGLIMLVFRLDERDAYLAKDGNLYDAGGKLLGSSKDLKFVPVKPKSNVETRKW